jgi:Na+/melibiose symporter-like transporter
MKTERVHLITKLAYGFGQMAEAVKNTSFELFLFFYYNQVLGLSGSLVGLALLIALCVDGLTDPLIGSLSDGWRSRWGRRHPWMYLAALPMALSFYLLFSPPGDSSRGLLFAWLVGFAMMVRAAMTFYHVPHMALGAELSDNYAERSSIVGFRTAFSLLGSALLVAVGFSVFFKANAGFPNGQLNADAYPRFGLFFALLMSGVMWASAAGTHRQIPRLYQPSGEKNGFGVRRVFSDVRAVFRTLPFRILFAATLLFAVMRGFQSTLSLHAATYFWELTPDEIQSISLAIILGLLVGIPLARPLSARFEKKRIFLCAIAWALLFHVLPVSLHLGGWFPQNRTPELVWALVVFSLLGGIGAVQALVAAGSITADIADFHELATGRRQEGLFFGGLAFAGKAASGLGHAVAGIGVDLIDFPRVAVPGGVMTSKLLNFAFLYGPGVGLIGLMALLVLARFPLSHARVVEVQRLLANRRGLIHSEVKPGEDA